MDDFNADVDNKNVYGITHGLLFDTISLPDTVSVNSDLSHNHAAVYIGGFNIAISNTHPVKIYRQNKDGVWESLIDGCNGACAGWYSFRDLNWRFKDNEMSDDKLHTIAESADRFINSKFKTTYSSCVKLLRKQQRKIRRGAPLTRIFDACRGLAGNGAFIHHQDLIMDSKVNEEDKQVVSQANQVNEDAEQSNDENEEDGIRI